MNDDESPRYRIGSRKGAGGRPRVDPDGPARRVEVLLAGRHVGILDRLAEEHGSRSAAVRALLEAEAGPCDPE